MKKLISLVLALTMIFAMATTAFAYESEEKTATVTGTTADDGSLDYGEGYDGAWTIDVPAGITADEVDASQIAANYYVVVSWTVNSTLTYAADETCYTWNVYSDAEGTTPADATGNAASAGYASEGAVWSGEATVDISISNWSNREMTAAISFVDAAADEAKGVKVAMEIAEEISAETLTLPNAAANASLDGTLVTSVTPQTSTVTIDSANITAGEITADDTVIGQVKIVLTEATASAG